jgi:hypothetical protein
VNDFLSGGSMVACFAIALFFLRFWRETADRLFGIFALAFAVFGANRILILVLDDEDEIWVYVTRVVVFLLIIAAIVDKNRSSRPA